MLTVLPLVPMLGAALVLLPHVVLPASAPGQQRWNPHQETSLARGLSAWLAAGALLLCLLWLLAQAPAVLAAEVVLAEVPWVPEMGLAVQMRLDALAWMFATLITAMGLLVVLYAWGYLAPNDSIAKLYSLLLVFAGAMLGIVLSDNLLLLLVYWELTSVTSFLLVGYWGHRPDARRGARMALTVTGGGGLAMLAGFVLLGNMAGTYQISALPAMAAQWQAHPVLMAWAAGLILVGCFSKSAQFPFHIWLPHAMAAPTPVSAYLHSATMVKAGIFLLLRLHPTLGGSEVFQSVVMYVGLLTLLFAAAVALFKHDLKALLAYSTISHLGLVVCLIGMGSPLAIAAAVLHVLNHACFKAALFMTAGIVDHQTGTRDLRKIGGLYALMPLTATAAMLAAAGMAGVPLFNGFVSKEMFLQQALAQHGWWTGLAATAAALLSVAYSVRLAHNTFIQPAQPDFAAQLRHNPHATDPHWQMLLPVALLAALCVLAGLWPDGLLGTLVRSVSSAVLGQTAAAHTVHTVHLAVWHGLNLPLLASLLALAGGVGLYAKLARHDRLRHLHIDTAWGGAMPNGAAVFDRGIDRLFGLAGRVTQRTENGSLQRYVRWLLGAALVAVAWPLVQTYAHHGAAAIPGAGTRAPTAAGLSAYVLWGTVLLACVALLRWYTVRFLNVMFVSVIGLASVLVFVAFSSPDLALTQAAVEVVTAVVLLLGLALVPQASPAPASRWRVVRDALVAAAVGLAVGWLAWVMLTRPHDSIAWFFLHNALTLGGGSNVVNVILVDFRGYDTMGEISVLAIAGLGVLALMHGVQIAPQRAGASVSGWDFARAPLMLRSMLGVLLPLALLVALYIFLRGHNQPGGGFIAGLVTAVAIVMLVLAQGQGVLLPAGHDATLRWSRLMAAGLATAWLTGIGALLWGYPFLTSAHGHPHLPVLGALPLASAAVFDLGVYLVVVGSVVLILMNLGKVTQAAQTTQTVPGTPPAAPLPAHSATRQGDAP